MQVNSRTRVTRDYAYFLENRLRARFGMDGVPLVIDFNERGSGRARRPPNGPVAGRAGSLATLAASGRLPAPVRRHRSRAPQTPTRSLPPDP